MGKRTSKHVSLSTHFTNLRDMFWHIWANQPHYSLISGQPLGRIAKAHYFAHVLSRAAYPNYKFYPGNIILMTMEEHHIYDRQTDKARRDPQYDWLFLYAEHLKTKYYNDKRSLYS